MALRVQLCIEVDRYKREETRRIKSCGVNNGPAINVVQKASAISQ